MRWVLATTLLLAAAACGSSDSGGGGSGSGSDGADSANGGGSKTKKPDGKPRPQPKLELTLDGKPIKAATALAYKLRDGHVRVMVSTVPVSCDQATADLRTIYNGEVEFEVDLASQLQPDGSKKLTIVQTSFEGSTHVKPEVTNGSGDGVKDQSTTVDINLEMTSVSKPRTITAKGTVDAIGCEAPVPSGKAPKPLPDEMPATLRIAGVKLPIRSVRFRPGKWPELELSTGGETCAREAGERDGEFVVTLTWLDAAKPQVSQVTLAGTMLPTAMDQTFDKAKIVVDPSPPNDKTTSIKLDGAITAYGYPLEVHGTVTPQQCK